MIGSKPPDQQAVGLSDWPADGASAARAFVTWATAPVEFSLSSSQPEDATARGIPTFPELGTKRSPWGSRGFELEEKDSS